MPLTKPYLEQMRAHVDEGGQLNHRNAVDLLAEVERLNEWADGFSDAQIKERRLCEARIQEIEHRSAIDGRETTAKWMMEHGYATGHGDTIEDLLGEMEWQASDHATRDCIKAMTAASHALKSYIYGNASPDLAASTAAFVDEAIKTTAGKSSNRSSA